MAPAKRSELTLVALLLVGCIGAILFVFALMSDEGGAFNFKKTENSQTEPGRPARATGPARGNAEEAPPAAPSRTGHIARQSPANEPAEPGPPAARQPEVIEAAEAANDYEGVAAVLTIELMQPAPDEDRAVKVQVNDAVGGPVPGALVVFREGRSVLYRERTDASGFALFEPYPNEKGPFRVDAVAHGYVTATAASVAAGAETELTLETRSSVSGVVRAPVKGTGLVRLYTGERELTQKISEDGKFRFEDIDPGVVTVVAEVEPHGADSVTLDLRPGEDAFVRLHVRSRGQMKIWGEIVFWPGKGDAWINGHRVPVLATGRYQFDKAVVGFNEILIDAPGKAPVRERFTVVAGQKSQYRFVLRSEGRIRGRVRDEKTKQPIRGAEVRVGYDAGDPRNDRTLLFPILRVPVVKTDSDGLFEIGRLDKRMIYLVSVVAPGHGQHLGDAVPSGGRVTIELPRGPFIFGKVRGLGGLPKGAVLTTTPLDVQPLSRYFNVSGFDRSRAERGRGGDYQLSGLLPGPHLLRVDAPGFGSIETVVDLFDRNHRVRLDLRVRRGADVDQDEIELLRRLPPTVYGAGEGVDAGEARGSVTVLRIDANRDAIHEPFAAVLVRFFDGEAEFTAPMEFAELEFELLGLPEGTYRAFLSHPSLPKPLFRDQIRLVHGEPYTIEFR